MSEDLRASLEELTARIERQEEELRLLRSTPTKANAATPGGRYRRFRRAGLAVTLVVALVAFPMLALATIQVFNDVPPTNPFYNDIQAVYAAGVAAGCGGGNYCPTADVTREQMAAFLNRLGALSAGKTPVVNAAKLDGLDSSGYLHTGDITMQQLGSWAPNGNTTGVTVKEFTNTTEFDTSAAGGGAVQMSLVSPTSIAGLTYGLKSVTICWYDYSANVSITATNVAETKLGGSATYIISDSTTRDPTSTNACYTVTDATPTIIAGNQVLLLGVNFTAAGRLDLTSVTTTWAPTTAPAAAPSTSSPSAKDPTAAR